MARDVADYVNAIKDDLRGQIITGYLSEDQIAGLVGSALGWLNAKCPNLCSFTPTTTSGRVTASDTFTPDVGPWTSWGMLIRKAALLALASSGAIARGEDNMGQYQYASHSANLASRAVQHRLNEQMLRTELYDLLEAVKQMQTHDQNDVDFTTVTW